MVFHGNRIAHCLCASSLLLLMMGIAQAQNTPTQTATTKPILQTLFTEGSDGGWKAFGPTAKAQSIRDETFPGTNKDVLKFEYAVAKGELNLLLLPVAEGELAAAKAFRFRVKTDYATSLVLVLQEQNGGRYSAVFHVPANTWQEVALSPGDFLLGEEPNDPKDPNGKLDMNQVNGIALTDFLQIFAQSRDPNVSKLIPIPNGGHTLRLTAFQIEKEPLPMMLGRADARIDNYAYPQIGWFPLAGVQPTLHSGKPLPASGLAVTYTRAEDKLAGIVRPFPKGKLSEKTVLNLNLAAKNETKLILQLEERGGGKYNTLITVPAGTDAKAYQVRLADMVPAEDSKDTNQKLDVEKVYQVVLIDLTALLEKAAGNASAPTKNTLYIGEIRGE